MEHYSRFYDQNPLTLHAVTSSLPSALNLPSLSSSKPSVVLLRGFGTQNEDDHLLCDWADSPRGLLHLYL